jgi:hypothetical protein
VGPINYVFDNILGVVGVLIFFFGIKRCKEALVGVLIFLIILLHWLCSLLTNTSK